MPGGRTPASTTDIANVLHYLLETNPSSDCTTYNVVKKQCLEQFTLDSFETHKTYLKQLLKSREQLYVKGTNQLNVLSKTTIRTGLLPLSTKETQTVWTRWTGTARHQNQNQRNTEQRRQHSQLVYENVLNDQLGHQWATRFKQATMARRNDTAHFQQGDQVQYTKTCLARTAIATNTCVSGTILQIHSTESTCHVQFNESKEDAVVEQYQLRKCNITATPSPTTAAPPTTTTTSGEQKDNTSGMTMVWFGSAFTSKQEWSALYGAQHATSGLRLTNTLANMYSALSQCNPLLPSIIGIMLHVVPEAMIFTMVQQLVEASEKYLIAPHTIASPLTVVPVCMSLIKTYGGPSFHNHLYTHLDVTIVWRMFVQFLSNTQLNLSLQIRLLDVYLKEGIKVLYRFVVGIFLINKKSLMHCQSTQDMSTFLLSSCMHYSHLDYMALAKKAFNLNNLQRKKIDALGEHFNAQGSNVYRWDLSSMVRPGGGGKSATEGGAATTVRTTSAANALHIVGTAGTLLNNQESNNLALLHSFLPPTYQQYDLKLLYTSSEDGCRLSTLYQRAPSDDMALSSSILIVRPANEPTCLIGCMLSCSFRPLPHTIDRRNPDCVLFCLNGKNGSQCWKVDYSESGGGKEQEGNPGKALSVDQRIVNASEGYLQIGVSSTANFEQSGLYLDDKLNVGYSGACDVFGCGKAYARDEEDGGGSKFMVGVVELYGLGRYR